MYWTIFYATIAALGAAGLACRFAIKFWIHKNQDYIKRYTRCGALPPKPTPTAMRRFKRIVRLIVYIQVGKVRFEGLHNAHVAGPKLITPNHGSYADVAVTLAFDEPLRPLAAQGVFAFGNGLGALLFGPIGAIPVDLRPGKGQPALDTAVYAVTSGEPLLIFPEGWAYMDGRVGEFKKGAVRIAREAGVRLMSPVHLVPTYMRYGTYPGKWILRFPPPVQYLLAFILSCRYRRGLTVVFGEPINVFDLPRDNAAATAILKKAVLAADPAVRARNSNQRSD